MTSEYPQATTPLGREAETLYQQGFDAYQQQQVVAARRLLEQSLSLFREAEHIPGILRSQHILANIAFSEGQYTLDKVSEGPIRLYSLIESADKITPWWYG